MAETISRVTTFEIIDCPNCGMPFGATENFIKLKRGDKESFYCPRGHSMSYGGESDKDKAQRLAGQLDMERTRRAEIEKRLDYAERVKKAASTRLRNVKKRVAHGTCPCCHRTFKQLAQHMAHKHPGYAGEPDHEAA